MYSTICLFPWLPEGYNFRAAVMKVFNISAEQLVCLRICSANNILIFKVASADVFNRVSEFYFRTLYFPLLGLNVLECFAYPKSRQYQFFKMSAFPPKDMTHTVTGLGVVLYKRHMSNKGPSMSGIRKDSVGVLIRMNEESSNAAEAATAPPTRERRTGSAQGGQRAARPTPYEPVAGPSRAPADSSARRFRTPACPLHSGFPYHHKGTQTHRLRQNGRKIRRRCCQCGHRIRSSAVGQSSPAEAPVKEKRVAQGPPPNDQSTSASPTVEGQDPKASDEDKKE